MYLDSRLNFINTVQHINNDNGYSQTSSKRQAKKHSLSLFPQSLGVRGVRLASILKASDYLASHTAVVNYTAVDPLLGTLEDLKMLATHLHQRDMYLLMDLPLAHATG